jgi:hypothetical protein
VSTSISTGKPVELPTLQGRSTTLIDRHGDHIAALIHDPALDDEPELLEGVGPLPDRLENARLDAELSPARGAPRLPRAHRRGGAE